MKPQPAHISGMIHKRRRARERRAVRGAQIIEWRKDLRGEAQFERALASEAAKHGKRMAKLYEPHLKKWGICLYFKERGTGELTFLLFTVTPLAETYQNI